MYLLCAHPHSCACSLCLCAASSDCLNVTLKSLKYNLQQATTCLDHLQGDQGKGSIVWFCIAKAWQSAAKALPMSILLQNNSSSALLVVTGYVLWQGRRQGWRLWIQCKQGQQYEPSLGIRHNPHSGHQRLPICQQSQLWHVCQVPRSWHWHRHSACSTTLAVCSGHKQVSMLTASLTPFTNQLHWNYPTICPCDGNSLQQRSGGLWSTLFCLCCLHAVSAGCTCR